jgi:hypothetical protein
LARPLIPPATGGSDAPDDDGPASPPGHASPSRRAASARGGSTTLAGTGKARRRWVLVLLLALGWVIQAGLRAWFGRMQVVPLANPDETAYLIAARVLAGGSTADLSYSTLYQGGYPLLITPVYWFTSDPATVYHAVVAVNSAIGAALLPLGYLACRRLGLGRPAAYGVAFVAALLPDAFIYSQFAMSDAIFPVLTLAWLLTTHSWLTAASARGRYAAAVGSALLAGFAYATHSRGLVMLAGYAAVGAFLLWRRPAARASVAVAGLTALGTVAAGWALNRYLVSVIYPEGTRSLSGRTAERLTSVHGLIHVFEMAVGQLWRVILDGWGIAGIGLVAAVAVAVRGGPRGVWGDGSPQEQGGSGGDRSPRASTVRTDLRIMAGLSVGVSVLIALIAPAALPPDQPQAWANGRYLDGMIVVFFLAGATVLLRAGLRPVLACAACVTGLFVLSALTVAVYVGSSVPTAGFAFGLGFGQVAVLTQNWDQASVLLATAVTLGLLAVWIALSRIARRWRPALLVLGAGLAAVSLVAVAQITSNVSWVALTRPQAVAATGLLRATGLKPGEQIAVENDFNWQYWVPQAFEVYWTEIQYFDPDSEPPPAGVTVVETTWPDGQPAQASWPDAPAGWDVVASDRDGDWVAWRKG